MSLIIFLTTVVYEALLNHSLTHSFIHCTVLILEAFSLIGATQSHLFNADDGLHFIKLSLLPTLRRVPCFYFSSQLVSSLLLCHTICCSCNTLPFVCGAESCFCCLVSIFSLNLSFVARLIQLFSGFRVSERRMLPSFISLGKFLYLVTFSNKFVQIEPTYLLKQS